MPSSTNTPGCTPQRVGGGGVWEEGVGGGRDGCWHRLCETDHVPLSWDSRVFTDVCISVLCKYTAAPDTLVFILQKYAVLTS